MINQLSNTTALYLSIIIPIYNEQDNIEILYHEIRDSADNTKIPYEIVFVDDGSNDNTLSKLLRIKAKEDQKYIDSKCGGEMKVFMDLIQPDPSLIIIGSGHIALPLAWFAHRTGFKLTVVDDAETANKERFPIAEIINIPFKEALERLVVRPSDYLIIVHGETGYELQALRSILRRKPAYIGLLGSKNKAVEHKKQLLREGFPKEDVDEIQAPIGLDIGAETPEEIAISILAELINVKRC